MKRPVLTLLSLLICSTLIAQPKEPQSAQPKKNQFIANMSINAPIYQNAEGLCDNFTYEMSLGYVFNKGLVDLNFGTSNSTFKEPLKTQQWITIGLGYGLDLNEKVCIYPRFESGVWCDNRNRQQDWEMIGAVGLSLRYQLSDYLYTGLDLKQYSTTINGNYWEAERNNWTSLGISIGFIF